MYSSVIISLIEHVYIFLYRLVARGHIELTMMSRKDVDDPNGNRSTSGETDRALDAACRCYPKSRGMPPTRLE